jgi:hypothetical protein
MVISINHLLGTLTALIVICANPNPNLLSILLQKELQVSPSPSSRCSQFMLPADVVKENECFPVYSSFEVNYTLVNFDRTLHSQSFQKVTSFKGVSRLLSVPDDCKGTTILEPHGLLKVFSQVRIWRGKTTTYFKGRNVFSYSQRYMEKEDINDNFLHWSNSTSTTNLSSAFLIASQRAGSAMYHAFVEKGCFFGAARELFVTFPDMKLIVDKLPLHLLQFAELFGLDSTKFVVQTDRSSSLVQVGKLFVPYPGANGTPAAAFLLKTRDWLRDSQHTWYNKTRSTDIILVHRMENGICTRCVLNSDELFEALKNVFPSRKVSHLLLGEMSMGEIGESWSSAEKIIEIHNDPRVCFFLFFQMATSLGLTYYGVAPAVLDPPLFVNYSMANVTFVVDAAKRMLFG